MSNTASTGDIPDILRLNTSSTGDIPDILRRLRELRV
jgi:hypothetical protein